MDYQKLLERQVNSGRINHAYIFVGKYANKMAAAHWFINQLKCDKSDIVEIIEPEGSIAIEKVRELKRNLSLSPYNSQWKVAVVSPADKMTTEAQNSLLKILEEPAKSVIIILLTDNEEAILPTIFSRCQRIVVKPDTTILADIGKPLPDGIYQGKWSVQERFALAEKLAKDENLEMVLDSWLMQLRERLISSREKRILGIIEAVQEAKKMIQSNANSRLILENMLLETERYWEAK